MWNAGLKLPLVVLLLVSFSELHALSAAGFQGPDTSALRARAQAALDANNLEEARPLLEELAELDSQNAVAGQALIDVLMRLNQWERAAAQARRLRLRFPADANVTLLAAKVAFRTNRFEEAQDLGEEAIKLDSKLFEAYRILAFSRFLLENYDGFRSALESLLKVDPDNDEAYYHLGRYFYENQEFSDALRVLRKAVEFNPRNYRAAYFLGWCEQAQGNVAAAEKAYRDAVKVIGELKERYGWPYSDLGDLLIAQGKSEEGLGWLYRGHRNDPTLPYAHYKYASALFKSESTPEVEMHALKAVELDSGYGDAFYLLGRYYQKEGDQEKAKQAFARFQELRKNPQMSPFGLRR